MWILVLQLTVVWPWANYRHSLCFPFLISPMRMMITACHIGFCHLQKYIHVKHTEEQPAHSKYSMNTPFSAVASESTTKIEFKFYFLFLTLKMQRLHGLLWSFQSIKTWSKFFTCCSKTLFAKLKFLKNAMAPSKYLSNREIIYLSKLLGWYAHFHLPQIMFWNREA